MKFGKYLAKRRLDLPEYASHFMNYKALKKLINRLAVAAPSQPADADDSPEAAFRRLQEHKATFFFQLERELETVQTFYRHKEYDLEIRLEILMQKKQATLSSGTLSKTSVSYISLHEGFQRFRRDLERLEQFIELNGTGFSKVLKKWDKRSRSQTKELYLSRAVEVQPMFNRDKIVALSDKVTASLLEIEALDSGEKVVFEAASHGLSESSPSDDLYYEFIKFASTFDRMNTYAQEAMGEWIKQLKTADHPKERFSQVFLLAISTRAADDALLALYNTGFVDLSTVDEISSCNALHLAASTKDRMKVIRLALDKEGPALINQVDVYGKTPLHYASINNRRDLLPLLLDSGAEIDVRDHDNFSALHYSIFYNFSGCTEILVDRGANVTGDSERDYVPLNFACQYGSYDAVRILLDRHPELEQLPDAEGLYPIHIVARAGFPSIVPLLTAAGANVNELDKLNSWSALMYAASEGMFETVKVLLDQNADWKLLDERGHTALFYACWEGHPQCVHHLSSILPRGTADISRDLRIPALPSARTMELSASLDDMELESTFSGGDLEGIPDLLLPPPIIPLQRYGHNFLDSKKVVLQIVFDTRLSTTRPVRFNEDRKFLSAGRMTMATNSAKDSIPRNIVLPIPDIDRVQTFQVDDLEKFSIDFEVLPTFGTRVMAKTTALSSEFDNKKIVLPLMNALMRHVGELEFSVLVIKPYAGRPLEIAKYDTYWKSTSFIDPSSLAYPHGHGHAVTGAETFQSTFAYVTDSSLHGDYVKTPIVLTRDGIPVVSNRSVQFHGLELAVNTLTFAEVQQLAAKSDSAPVQSLSAVLEAAPPTQQLNLYVPYPTPVELELPERIPVQWPDMNAYVDRILHSVFEYVRGTHKRGVKPSPLMFTSTNPKVCAAFNWKQANYPVFFIMNALRTDGRYTTANNDVVSDTPLREQQVCVSIKEASQFAASNNLMGIILPSDVLKLVPTAVSATRVLGLVLVAAGKVADDVEGVDAIETGDVMRFPS